MPQKIKALLLDFDGTLADSIGVMRDIYYRYLREFGHEGNEEEFVSFNGPTLPVIVKAIKEKYGLPGSENELLARYEEIINADYGKAGAMPGAQDIIGLAKDKKLTCGIVTSGKAVWVKAWLQRNHLSVDFIVDRNSTAKGKPAPDPYLEALKQAGHAAAEAVAVEDTGSGVKAALAAGIKTYGVGVDVPGAVAVKNLQDVIDALNAG